MKAFIKIIVVIAIVIGGTVMAKYNGDCEAGNYAQYSSEDAEINITMDYVADWQIRESRGSYGSYAQVQFIGPKQDILAPSMSVTVEKNKNPQAETIETKADDLVKKRMYYKEAKVLSRSAAELLNAPAIDITLTYIQMDKLLDLEAKSYLAKERVVIVQKDGKFYTLQYVNPEKVFSVFEEDFQRCIETLRIKE